MVRFRFRTPWATALRLGRMIKSGERRDKDKGILTDVFSGDDGFRLEQGDLSTYQGFRHQEPNLVSIVDGKPEMAKNLDALVFRIKGIPVGAVSYLVQRNTNKSPPNDFYGRIDIVIVPGSARGAGLGRLLLLSANLVMLRGHGSSLYSISCLAAHPAVAAVLESMGYTPARRENTSFVHEELRLEGEDWRNLERDFSIRLRQSFQQVRYSLRQQTVNG